MPGKFLYYSAFLKREFYQKHLNLNVYLFKLFLFLFSHIASILGKAIRRNSVPKNKKLLLSCYSKKNSFIPKMMLISKTSFRYKVRNPNPPIFARSLEATLYQVSLCPQPLKALILRQRSKEYNHLVQSDDTEFGV